MAQGPPLYIRCPGCGEIEQFDRPDGDFQDLDTRWTDSYNFEWSLRGFSDDLLRGYSCGKLFWRSSAEVIRNPLRDVCGGVVSKSAEPPFPERVDGQPYHLADAIEQGMCLDHGQEIHVRMRVWWNFNHPFRPLLDPNQGKDHCRIIAATVERPQSFVLNAIRLMELLQPSDARERILTAELHRQLGNFDAAVSLLSNTANLFFALQELEREQSRLFLAEVRKRIGNDPTVNCSARSEVLITVARRILNLALEEDTLVRPVEQQFAEFDEADTQST